MLVMEVTLAWHYYGGVGGSVFNGRGNAFFHFVAFFQKRI